MHFVGLLCEHNAALCSLNNIFSLRIQYIYMNAMALALSLLEAY